MRALLIFALMVGAFQVSRAQDPLEGTYVRYKPGHIKQVLKLSGLSSGTYSLTKTKGAEQHYINGFWRREKMWRPHTDSMDVIALDYENDYETSYLQVESTGCLTPVDDDGYRRKRANSFAPAKKQRLDR